LIYETSFYELTASMSYYSGFLQGECRSIHFTLFVYVDEFLV